MGKRRYRGFSLPDVHEMHEAGECLKWCKVHHLWDFEADRHVAYPASFNILTSGYGWVKSEVFVGPPAYFPKREAAYR